MTSKVLDENQYFNLVASIAMLNQCKLLNINYSERIIHLSGPKDAVRFCTDELEALLGRYHPGQPGSNLRKSCSA
jgi:hypothetical protein